MALEKAPVSWIRLRGASYGQNLKECFHLPGAAGRDSSIEAMKGFAIILVVLSHAIRLYIGQPQNIFWRNVFYSFHMPLFFFLSGYVAYAGVRKYKAGELLRKKFRSLIVPFLSWYFLFGAVATLLFRDYGFAKYTWFIIKNPYTGRWFLLVLFYCFAALLAAVWLEKYLEVFAFPLIVLALSIIPWACGLDSSTDFLGLKPFQQVLIFLFAGYLCAGRAGRTSVLPRRGKAGRVITGASLVAFPLLVMLGMLFPQVGKRLFVTYMATNPYLTDAAHLLAVLVAFLGIAFVFSAFRLAKDRRGVGWLAWLGAYSLDIYVIHSAGGYFILRIMAGPLVTSNPALQILVLSLLVACATAFSLFVSIFVLRQSRLLKALFLGKTSPGTGFKWRERIKTATAPQAAGGRYGEAPASRAA